MADIQRQTAERVIKAGYFNRNVFRQKEKLILVLKTGIAGMYFHVDMESSEGRSLIAKLVPGAELFLYREADNEYDQWAISVYSENDKQIGYVTRFKNEAIARLMDCGKRFFAFVDEPPGPSSMEAKAADRGLTTEDFTLPFSIYLEDK